MDKEKVEYIPFHAINEFMRGDFRLTILQEVLATLDQATPIQKQLINRLISKRVQIPGFRNSGLAPVSMKVKNSTSLFENSPEFASTVIECWSNLHQDLKKTVYQLLSCKGWEILPVDVDRSKLPGFLIDWPKVDTFEVLIKGLKEIDADTVESDDNISLMAVWVGNRLPYNIFSE